MKTILARPSRQAKRCSARALSMRDAPSLHKFWPALVIAVGVFCAGTGQALADYIQTNLVSSIPVWRPSPILC